MKACHYAEVLKSLEVLVKDPKSRRSLWPPMRRATPVTASECCEHGKHAMCAVPATWG